MLQTRWKIHCAFLEVFLIDSGGGSKLDKQYNFLGRPSSLSWEIIPLDQFSQTVSHVIGVFLFHMTAFIRQIFLRQQIDTKS